MKIIDEKGRLFGKINVIDFFVVISLICLIPMIYFSSKKLSKQSLKRELIDIEILCNLIKLNPETLKLIAVGDKEIDNNTGCRGEITEVGKDKPYRYKISLGKGTDNNEALVFTESSILREVPIKIKLKAEIRNSVMYYKDIPIDLNSQFILTTNKYTAIVVPVLYVKEKWLTVKVKFLRMPPEINPLVAKGHIEKDYAGRIVGRLIEILEASSSQVSVLKVQENKIIFINDPYYKDIIASIEILCSEKDGALYFKNSPVLIGGQITFNSGLYVITGSISGIEG